MKPQACSECGVPFRPGDPLFMLAVYRGGQGACLDFDIAGAAHPACVEASFAAATARGEERARELVRG